MDVEPRRVSHMDSILFIEYLYVLVYLGLSPLKGTMANEVFDGLDYYWEGGQPNVYWYILDIIFKQLEIGSPIGTC